MFTLSTVVKVKGRPDRQVWSFLPSERATGLAVAESMHARGKIVRLVHDQSRRCLFDSR